MQRRFLDYFIIAFKGIAMGAADAVPGVSGGTIAFISGIYEELITTISNIKPSLITVWRKEGFKTFWKAANGSFLLALLSGIIVSFVTFMRLAKYLLEHHPVLIWSFFFGLIVASIYYVAKQITKWRILTLVAIIVGALIAFYITTLPSMGNSNSSLFLFFAGAIAICAMILPGISGSFILVVLGAYKTLSDAIHDFDFKRLAIFIAGAIIGLLSFSRVLKWLFKNYHNATLALLSGFIIGSLNKVWPWKRVLSWRTDSEGLKVPFKEESVLPTDFSGEPQVLYAIILMIVGFFTILILERLGNQKNSL
ncbi:DUF368 domain-containing protein [Winogradskyella pulchriflava]|uniref:DUF368 domain-containing protein n=1 Tax=Winogradskyella pulchriflava TaxID=1110688 RepID=A0ABV6QAS8_9FLAO